MSDWMIHTAWLDHCPNTVVEALGVEVPVICAEDGGTKELVRNYGIVLKEYTPYDFQLTDYENPPRLDIKQIQNTLPERRSLGMPPDVSIELCAKKYIDAFEDILNRENT